MRQVSIIGIGQTKVKEHWDRSLRDLAVEATLKALKDAHVENLDAIYVGNMLSGELTGQENLGALVADWVGMRGTEAFKIEAACGSGAAAVHMGYLAVASGQFDTVAIVGAEKLTESSNCNATAALAMAADGDYEAMQGLSFVGINALLMRRYMHEYDLTPEDFAPFSLNAHANGVHNPYAMFNRAISFDAYKAARTVADPINVLDSAPIGDGAAAIIITASQFLNGNRPRSIRIAASTSATDAIALHDRHDPLWLTAVEKSAKKAYAQANITPQDIDFFEIHDAFSIMSAMSLEASGFVPRGTGAFYARDNDISPKGKLPLATMGGLKARGHPVGATGVYQIVEAVTQMRGEAGKNQVANPEIAMAQSFGGVASNVSTHILMKN